MRASRSPHRANCGLVLLGLIGYAVRDRSRAALITWSGSVRFSCRSADILSCGGPHHGTCSDAGFGPDRRRERCQLAHDLFVACFSPRAILAGRRARSDVRPVLHLLGMLLVLGLSGWAPVRCARAIRLTPARRDAR